MRAQTQVEELRTVEQTRHMEAPHTTPGMSFRDKSIRKDAPDREACLELLSSRPMVWAAASDSVNELCDKYIGFGNERVCLVRGHAYKTALSYGTSGRVLAKAL